MRWGWCGVVFFSVGCNSSCDVDGKSDTSGVDDGLCVEGDAWANFQGKVAIYASAEAGGSGDGSIDNPFFSLQEAIDAASETGVGLVLVEEGTYFEALVIKKNHDGVQIVGRCRDGVVLDASGSGEDVEAIAIHKATVVISDLTIRGGQALGIIVDEGGMTLERAFLRENQTVGIGLFGEGAWAEVDSIEIEGGVASQEGDYFYGLAVAQKGSLTGRNIQIRGAKYAGIRAYHEGSSVDLGGVHISETLPARDTCSGFGVFVSDGASVRLEDSEVVRSSCRGVVSQDATTTIDLINVKVSETSSDEEGNYGYGLFAYDGGTIYMRQGSISDNHCAGSASIGPYSEIKLEGVTVSRTLFSGCAELGGASGGGVAYYDASLLVSDSEISENEFAGILIGDATAVIQETIIEKSVSGDKQSGGYGVLAFSEGRAFLNGVIVEDNAYMGVAIEGGSVAELFGTVIRRNTSFGLSALGEETFVTLGDVEVSNTFSNTGFSVGGIGVGVNIQDGASIEVRDSTIQENRTAGVFIRKATAVLERVEILDTIANLNGKFGHGVSVGVSSVVEMDDVLVANNTQTGLFIEGPKTFVSARDLEIKNTQHDNSGLGGRGVNVQYGSHFDALNTIIQDNHEGGLFVSDSGTMVLLSDTIISGTLPNGQGNLGRGLVVQCGASLYGESLSVASNHEVGVSVSSGDGGGCENAQVDLVDVEVIGTQALSDGSGGRGISVHFDAKLMMERGVIRNNREGGLVGHGEDVRIELKDVEIEGTQRSTGFSVSAGLAIESGVHLNGENVVISGTDGPGLYVSEASAELVGGSLNENTVAGISLLKGEVSWVGGEITDNGEDTNEGMGVGVFVDGSKGETSLTLSGVTVSEHPYAAVWLVGEGNYTLTNNTLLGGLPYELAPGVTLHGNALFAVNGVSNKNSNNNSGLWLSGNDFSGSEGVDVLLHGASASFAGDNTWSDSGPQLVQQRCDDIEQTPPDGYEEAPSASICPSPEHLVEDFDFDIEFSIPEIVDSY